LPLPYTRSRLKNHLIVPTPAAKSCFWRGLADAILRPGTGTAQPILSSGTAVAAGRL
jgi:hypothetical protein